jgi:hypothetical protein
MSADQPSRPPEPKAPEPRRKKPYVKPAFEYERVFETMALACGKTNPIVHQCSLVRKNS